MSEQTPILTPSTAELITRAIESRLLELHTGLPAKVVSFDPSTQTCSVQPLLLRVVVVDGEFVEERLPQITSVPVVYPSAGGWSLIFPLLPDDLVFLTFAERSLDAWMDAEPGLEVDPVQTRKHDLSDAICVPGLRPRTKPNADLPGLGSNLRLGFEGGDPAIVLKTDGTIEIGEGATERLVLGDILHGLLSAHTHGTAFGASGPPNNAAQFESFLSPKGRVK